MEISEIKKDNEELKEKLINEIKEQKELKIQIENIELINKNIEDRIKSIYDIIIKNKYNIINESKNKRISEEHSNCQIYKENRIENDYKNYYEVIDRISRYRIENDYKNYIK